jgi:hypothetical protein
MEHERFPINSLDFRDPDGRWKTMIFYREGKQGLWGVYSQEEGRRVYLECDTEYEAAMRFVTSWEHWKEIAKSAHCKPLIDLWREEKMMQDQTRARKMLWKAAEQGNLSAARTIYEAKKEEKEQKQKTKAHKEQESKEQEILGNTSAKLISIKAQG